MLTTKLLKNTFGAKIKPYGFQYKGFKHRRWTFQFEINNKIREIVVQKDLGSFQLELNFPCSNHKIGELFGDLKYHSTLHKNDEELEIWKQIIDSDIKQLNNLKSNLNNWDKAYQIAENINFETWSRKKAKSETAQEKKPSLKKVKNDIKEKLREQKLEDLKTLYYETLDSMRKDNGITWNDSAMKKAYTKFIDKLKENAKKDK